jgi:hypothetical protein
MQDIHHQSQFRLFGNRFSSDPSYLVSGNTLTTAWSLKKACEAQWSSRN